MFGFRRGLNSVYFRQGDTFEVEYVVAMNTLNSKPFLLGESERGGGHDANNRKVVVDWPLVGPSFL